MSVEREPIVLARVSGVYGVLGWVRLHSFTEPRDAVLDYRDCQLGQGQDWRPARIAAGKKHGKGLIVQFAGIEDRDAAQALIGAEVAVERQQMPDPEPGHYYWADLEGLAVRQVDGTDLGRVSHLLETGANDVLVVQGENEVLIPFLTGSVIKNVDLGAGLIVVDWEWE